MDAVCTEALLRLYAGHERDRTCRDLGITQAQLAEWESTIPTSELRPADLPYVAGTLQEIVPGSGTGMRPVTAEEAAAFTACEPGLDQDRGDQWAGP